MARQKAGKTIRVEANGTSHSVQQTMTSFLPPHLTQRMVFDSPEPVEIPVTISGDEYVLREADEGGIVAYKNANMRALRLGTEGGKIQIVGNDGNAESEPILVSHCLFQVCEDDKSEMTPVPLSTIMGWKPHVVHALFLRVKAISRLDDVDEESDTVETLTEKIAILQSRIDLLKSGDSPAKNSLSATTDTSV